MALKPKQQAFVDEYLVDLNATQAAIRAGYSEKSAASIGEENLRKPEIAAAVQAALDARAERTEVTQDMVVAELRAIAFSDLTDLASWTKESFSLIDSSQLTDEAKKTLKEVVVTTTTTGRDDVDVTTTRTKVAQHDKLKALELLGRHLGMFKRDLDVKVQVGITLGRLHELAAAADAVEG